MFLTDQQEWIDFHGIVAYVGIHFFKLTGLGEIKEVKLNEYFSYQKKGEEIARIFYPEVEVAIAMPADGSIIQVNDVFDSGDLTRIAAHLEGNGWIYSIIPSNPYDRKGLIPAKKSPLYNKNLSFRKGQ